jgi:hypothetical protein
VRGKSSRDGSDPRETVASFFSALGKNLPSARALHACAEAVFLVTAAHMGLKRAFRQRSFLLWLMLRAPSTQNFSFGFAAASRPSPTAPGEDRSQQPAQSANRSAHTRDPSELVSVCDRRTTVKEGAELDHRDLFPGTQNLPGALAVLCSNKKLHAAHPKPRLFPACIIGLNQGIYPLCL